MRLVFKIFTLLSLVSTFSCSQTQKKNNDNESNHDKIVIQGVDICDLNQQPVDTIILEIQKNAKLLLSSIKLNHKNEECIFKLIDKLSGSENIDSKNFLALEKLNELSDGFLSEYFMEVTMKFFNENNSKFLDFLQEKENSTLEKSLIDGLSMEISMEDSNIEDALKEALSLVKDERNKNFIRQLFDKVDPNKFD